MTWYYALGNERQGPVEDAELDRLIASGVVTNDTLVWRAGMADWQPLSQARPRPAIPPTPSAPTVAVPVARPAAPTPAAPGTPGAPTPDPATEPRYQTPSFGTPGAAAGAGSAWSGASAAGAAPSGSPEDLYARATSRPAPAIGEIVGRAWQLVSANLGLVIGSTVVVMVCMVVAGIIPCLGAIIGLVVNPVLLGGLYRLLLKLHRQEPAEFGDVFSTFSTSFLPLFLFGLVQAVLTFIAILPGYALIFLGTLLGERSEGLGVLISLVGLVVILPVAIYLVVSWLFSTLLIVDHGLDFWPAMELSRKVTARHFFPILGLAILGWLILVAGALALCIGLLFTVPLFFAMVTIAYDDLFSDAPAR
jgi:hypothetical protein